MCHSDGPGEIKRTEVVLGPQLTGPGEIKRREVVLDPVVSPEQIMIREVELGCKSWTFFCFKLLLNSGATDIVLETLP